MLQRFGVAERLGMDEVRLHRVAPAVTAYRTRALMHCQLFLQVFLDVTNEVQSRIAKTVLSSSFVGHIHTSQVGCTREKLPCQQLARCTQKHINKQVAPRVLQVSIKQETRHRPMDLRAARSRGRLVSAAVEDQWELDGCTAVPDWELALKVASTIAAEARAAVKVGCCHWKGSIQAFWCLMGSC